MREIRVGLIVIIAFVLVILIVWNAGINLFYFRQYWFEGIESVVDFFWISRDGNSYSPALAIAALAVFFTLIAGSIGHFFINTLGLYEDDAEDQEFDKLVDECVSDEDIDKIVDDVVDDLVEKSGNE